MASFSGEIFCISIILKTNSVWILYGIYIIYMYFIYILFIYYFSIIFLPSASPIAAGGASEIAAFSNFLNVGSLVGGH